MMMAFDPAKDATNVAKHGLSLADAGKVEPVFRMIDDRYDEPRYRLYGYIEDVAYCVAYTIRDGVVRVISFRRAHKKELRRYE